MDQNQAPMTAVTGHTFTNEQIDRLHNMIVMEPKQHNPVMTEATFRDYFLPVLSGEIQDTERLRIYMQGVAGPNVSVNVVDANGVFLFEVPPLFGTDHIKCVPDDKHTITFGNLADNVELMRHRSPRQADAMLREGLFKRMLASTTKNYQPTANERKWLVIFERYGIPLQNARVLSPENQNHHESPPSTPNNGSGADTATSQGPTPTNDFEVSGEY